MSDRALIDLSGLRKPSVANVSRNERLIADYARAHKVTRRRAEEILRANFAGKGGRAP